MRNKQNKIVRTNEITKENIHTHHIVNRSENQI